MDEFDYWMESDEENLRLDIKTNPSAVEKQALWAHVRPGMRVADLGCGSGKTTSVLHRLVQPGGCAIGVDIFQERVDFACAHYGESGIDFVRKDIRRPLDDLGAFDLVWIRFVLEYYQAEALDIVRNASQILRTGGTLVLIDLDLNCLNHFGLSERLESAINSMAHALKEKMNFDSYAGRKLYSYLYDTGYEDISVSVGAHHVIYGELDDVDEFNWGKKLEIASRKAGLNFAGYAGGCPEFVKDFKRFFSDTRRFSYTPLICAQGRKGTQEWRTKSSK